MILRAKSPEEALLISMRTVKRLSICLIRANEKHLINGEKPMRSIIETVHFADDQRRETDAFYYRDGSLRR